MKDLIKHFNLIRGYSLAYYKLTEEVMYGYDVDIGENDTKAKDEGSGFILNDPDTLKLNKFRKDQIVKRIKITKSDLMTLVNNLSAFNALLNEIHSYMSDNNCRYFTFKRPGEDKGSLNEYLKLCEDEDKVELRAYGVIEK